MKYTYLLVNAFAFVVPFVFSFHPRLLFYKTWKFTWPAIITAAIPFLLWDAYFTKTGIWGFTPSYICGIYLYNLPLEEVLFFICIPYSCLFTIYCFTILGVKDYFKKTERLITPLLLIILISTGLFFINRLYTAITFLTLALILAYLKYIIKASWLSRFYFSYLVLLLPFCIVNGILTGTGTDAPVVWYNNNENMNIRLLTIPLEDVFYGMLLIVLNLSVYHFINKKYAS